MHTQTHTNIHSLALSLLQNSPDRAAHLLKLLENWIDRESFSLSFPTRTSSEACRSDSARETAGKAPAPAANGLTILKNNTKLEQQQQQGTRESISSRSPNPTCWPTQHDLLVVWPKSQDSDSPTTFPSIRHLFSLQSFFSFFLLFFPFSFLSVFFFLRSASYPLGFVFCGEFSPLGDQKKKGWRIKQREFFFNRHILKEKKARSRQI